MCDVIIIGAGGHAKVIADIIVKSGDNLLGFLDDAVAGTVLSSYEVLGRVADAQKMSSRAKFIVGIGSSDVRKKIAEGLSVDWYSAIHPSAQIGLGVKIGVGTAIMANTVINVDARIGSHTIINTAAVVEHDCMVGDYAHISPNATLCGTVMIGNGTWIGSGATVRNNLSICSNVIVGAGAAVVDNIKEKGTYIGLPAEMKK